MNPNIVPRHTPTEEEWKVLATEELTHMSDEDQELLPGEWDEWIAEVRREAYERALAEHSRRQLHIEAMLAEYRDTLPKLLAGMRRVLELHSEDEETGWCNECTEGHMDYVSYPCPTIQKLQEAINDE